MSNMRNITITEMVSITEYILKSNVKKACAFLGLGGIGKSESMYALTKKLGIGYVDLRLLQYNITDFKGIPFKSEVEGYTKFLISDLLPREAAIGEDTSNPRFQERGILVLDEITSCTTSLRTLMYQLVNERCLGEYKLPDGWLIVLLGNGIDDGGDFNGIEGNLLNRCYCFRVTSSVDSFQDYLNDNFSSLVANLIGGYLQYKPHHLHTFSPDAVGEDDLVFASPRSWVSIAKLLDIDSELKNTGKVSEINKLLIAGAIGDNVALDFYSYIGLYAKLPKLDDILDGKYDLYISDNKYAKSFKNDDGVDERITKLEKVIEATDYVTSIKTSRERALGTVIINSLADLVIEEYSKISNDSKEYFNTNHTLDEALSNYLKRFINVCNFIADYLKGDMLRLFLMLVVNKDILEKKLENYTQFDYNTYMSVIIFHPDSMNSNINRANLQENTVEYLVSTGKTDGIELE